MSQVWTDMEHTERVKILQEYSDEYIVKQYIPDNITENDFLNLLNAERQLWKPGNVKNKKLIGQPPRKETILGAWRDLNRSEALLELIDNSIDAWLRRRREYPNQCAPELQIYIDYDAPRNLLKYEDNAGGVRQDFLTNLVIPGYSETDDLTETIGSYRTGGKRAVFRLATKARITTYYWNPVGTSDEAFEIHLDQDWMDHPTEYQFPVYELENRSEINKGQTIYNLQLRDTAQWSPIDIDNIEAEIRRTYTLMMDKYPQISIYFNNRYERIKGIEELYDWSGAKTGNVDIQPQQVTFNIDLEWRGISYPVKIEIAIGCRRTTAAERGEDKWGLDLYGNNRLFLLHDQSLLYKWFDLPSGNSQKMVRGYINIIGPNLFIPWDTHKRHLNEDREIVIILKNNPAIRELFREWTSVYNSIGSGKDINEVIKTQYRSSKPGKTDVKSVSVAHSQVVNITKKIQRKRLSEKLPESIHRPSPPPKVARTNSDIEIKITLNDQEFRNVCSLFDVSADADDINIRRQLTEKIKTAILTMKKR